MTAHSTRRAAFTRPEFVFVLALVLLAASVTIPAWIAVKQHRRLALAHADIRILVDAGNGFFHEYGVWPTARTESDGDVRFGREIPNREVIHALRAELAVGNENNAVNPQHISFLDAPAYRPGRSGINDAGDYLDPWGTPYQIVLDTDFNGVCDMKNSIYGRLMGEGLAIWSCGPDRISDTKDDLLSWKAEKKAVSEE